MVLNTGNIFCESIEVFPVKTNAALIYMIMMLVNFDFVSELIISVVLT